MALIDFLLMTAYFSVSMLFGIIGINSPQAYRPILLVGIASFAILAYSRISNSIYGGEIVALFISIYISHISCALCVEKYVLPKKPGIGFDWVGGYKMLFNARWIGTNRQVPDIKVPLGRKLVSDTVSEQRHEEHSRELSKTFRNTLRLPRTIFVLNCVISLACTLAAEKLYRSFYMDFLPHYIDGLNAMDFLPIKETYFRRFASVTFRETVIRVWIVTLYIGNSFCTYNTIHKVLAIIFVGTGLDEPEDWPPLFGDIREATSIRNFWAKFWHRLVYRSYSSYGIWITKNILRLPHSSFIGKLFINLYVFAMSGIVHALAIRQVQYSCGYWEEIRFYVLNFFAILVETMVLAVFSKVTKGYKVNSTVSKTIGYTWVFMFLFWVQPKTQYPKVFCSP
jgi:hypothetical protein